MTINMEEFLALAREAGFDNVGAMDVATIELIPEVRAACETGRCPAYNKNWSCPPALGTLEECDKMIKAYKRGAILQSTGEIEDDYDFEGMMDVEERHRKNFYAFAKKMKAQYPDMMFIGDGHCTLCEKCTYPDEACRFPNEKIASMEAMGMIVNNVCKANGMPYYYGAGTFTYTGCVLID